MGHITRTSARRWSRAVALGATLVVAATGSTVATIDMNVAQNNMSDAVREWRLARQAVVQNVAENNMTDAVREWRVAWQASEVSRSGDHLPLPQLHP